MTPTLEVAQVTKPPAGRARNNHDFRAVVAGGESQGGLRYGATDEFGFKTVENLVHVRDPHATMLHHKGLDHE